MSWIIELSRCLVIFSLIFYGWCAIKINLTIKNRTGLLHIWIIECFFASYLHQKLCALCLLQLYVLVVVFLLFYESSYKFGSWFSKKAPLVQLFLVATVYEVLVHDETLASKCSVVMWNVLILLVGGGEGSYGKVILIREIQLLCCKAPHLQPTSWSIPPSILPVTWKFVTPPLLSFYSYPRKASRSFSCREETPVSKEHHIHYIGRLWASQFNTYVALGL
jgi:hypothetical protein